MGNRLIAKVHVERAVLHFDKAFDYLVPIELEASLKRGCRVVVPFGNGNRKRQGMVYKIVNQQNQISSVKPICLQLDKEPIFDEEMFKIADFMVKNTFCTHYEAVKTILPNSYEMDLSEHYQLVKKLTEEQLQTFSIEERNLIEFLQTSKTQKELDDYLRYNRKPEIVALLLQKEIIKKEHFVKQKASDKTIQTFQLTMPYDWIVENHKLTPKQKEVVTFLSGVISATKKEISYFCGVGDGVIKRLQQEQIVQVLEREVFRIPFQKHTALETLSQLQLSQQQQQVFEQILEIIKKNQPQVGLLYGVTGSGKTSIFIKLIEQTIQSGKQALMLVPEIALTPQMLEKFKALFGDNVAVMHSGLSLGERLDEYKRMKQGKAQIVIGTRSAIFAPFAQIGLIIMDEEGEASYKSDVSPRYHTREIAKLRCVQHKAMLLLASATPSIESYYKAKKGIYHLFTLPKRYANAQLPEVYIVDMKEEERRANTSCVSKLLQQEIYENIKRREQSILLINRRGYHTIAQCMECGEVIKCPHCDVALTYHKDNNCLMCHYCGYRQKFEKECSSCHSPHLKLSGFGTQKIEDELQSLFPQALILRMDTDTTYSRYAYEKKFHAFGQGQYDILVGTQMIAKGLDFPNVTLVGVLNADNGLYAGDYRGVERVFSLITQVVGRSGRAQKSGRAYIQTYLPENPVIQFAAKQDYNSFYQDEIVCRKTLLYPPYCDICSIHFSGTQENQLHQAILCFLEILKHTSNIGNPPAMKIFGPIKPFVYRMNGKYRQNIYIKCLYNAVFRTYLKQNLMIMGKQKQMRNISFYVDINGDINV